MRILLAWTGSRRELHMFHTDMLLPGTHLQVLRDTQFEFIAELWHWREPFDFVGTAKPRARPSCAALIARRTPHG